MITKSVFGSALGAGFVAFAAAPALAQDSVTDRVEEFLANTQKQVEQAKLWKFEVHPSLRESVIWTDNVFLNDRGEDPLILRSMTTPGGTIVRNRSVLDRFEERHPAFRDRQSQGRVDDFIIQSELGVDLGLPVNEEYSRAFQQKHMIYEAAYLRRQGRHGRRGRRKTPRPGKQPAPGLDRRGGVFRGGRAGAGHRRLRPAARLSSSPWPACRPCPSPSPASCRSPASAGRRQQRVLAQRSSCSCGRCRGCCR